MTYPDTLIPRAVVEQALEDLKFFCSQRMAPEAWLDSDPLFDDLRAALQPSDPMDWHLPCDVTVGHGTMSKGVKLRTLVARMKALYEMATGQNADEVAERPMAVRDVLAERFRQISVEGWTPEHDDEHIELCNGRGLTELARAAKAYIEGDSYNWPWHVSSFKPTDTRRNLVKAAALILAEIERMDRAATKEPI